MGITTNELIFYNSNNQSVYITSGITHDIISSAVAVSQYNAGIIPYSGNIVGFNKNGYCYTLSGNTNVVIGSSNLGVSGEKVAYDPITNQLIFRRLLSNRYIYVYSGLSNVLNGSFLSPGIIYPDGISVDLSGNFMYSSANLSNNQFVRCSGISSVSLGSILVTESIWHATLDNNYNLCDTGGDYIYTHSGISNELLGSQLLPDNASNASLFMVRLDAALPTWEFYSPGSVVNDDSIGDVTWVNPENAKISDDNYAVATLTPVTFNTNWLKATNFGFNIPSSATINGIKVSLEGKTSVDFWMIDCVRIVKDGTIKEENKTLSYYYTSDTTNSAGGYMDKWGETWTAADINADDFGVAVATYAGGDTYVISVDYIYITVYYTYEGIEYQITMLSDGLNWSVI